MDQDKSDVVDEATAQVPIEELTGNLGVREAFVLYEAAAAQYSVATEYCVQWQPPSKIAVDGALPESPGNGFELSQRSYFSIRLIVG